MSEEIAIVPVHFNWDLTNRIGYAIIKDNGEAHIKIKLPDKVIKLTKLGTLRGMSVGYSYEVPEEGL